jgi:muramoyltetrapeptide carboxypeptidase
MQQRRTFLKSNLALLGLPLIQGVPAPSHSSTQTKKIKPAPLQAGDIVGICSPAGITYNASELKLVDETFEALGLKTKMGKNVLKRWGYLAGTDEERAADFNEFALDKNIKAILPLTGGWGCARTLPFIHFENIKNNPKIVMGFSDVTALLLALYEKSNLVCFHGPNAHRSVYNPFTVKYVKQLLFNNELVNYINESYADGELVKNRDRIVTINTGIAEGELIGGNLTVLTSLMGTPYFPNMKNKILFLEDVGEKLYRIDRMLTQLRLAGVFKDVSGIIFGNCSKCDHDGDIGGFTLEEVLRINIETSGKPCFTGSMIGHIANKFTIPLGVRARMDAQAGSFILLEKALA